MDKLQDCIEFIKTEYPQATEEQIYEAIHYSNLSNYMNNDREFNNPNKIKHFTFIERVHKYFKRHITNEPSKNTP